MARVVDTRPLAEQHGRALELAVGAELAQQTGELSYWRELNREVDFVYRSGVREDRLQRGGVQNAVEPGV